MDIHFQEGDTVTGKLFTLDRRRSSGAQAEANLTRTRR
jgi:hypothetical protein